MLSSWRGWLLVLVALLFSAWVVVGSKSFQACMQEEHHKSAKEDAIKGAPQFFAAVAAHEDCTGHFVDENGEGIIASFTIILAVSTILLWLATKDLFEAGEKQIGFTRIAAEAARDSANAAVAAERARFFIVINDFNIGDILSTFAGMRDEVMRMVGRSTEPAISYSLRNYGKTPGIIKEVSLGTLISNEPVDPVYSVTISSFPEFMIGAGDATAPNWAQHGSSLTQEEADALYRNQTNLWFFGCVDYEDVFSKPQCHRFYFRTVMWEGKCILQPYDYKHYNEST